MEVVTRDGANALFRIATLKLLNSRLMLRRSAGSQRRVGCWQAVEDLIRLTARTVNGPVKKREETMRCGLRIVLSGVLGALIAGGGAVWAADPEIDKLLQSPVGKDWVTNGGNLTNERYSTLKQIDTSNVKQLKGAWMTRLKGSGIGGKYSFEATPLVKDGVMYITTGNDDVFALNAKTGKM